MPLPLAMAIAILATSVTSGGIGVNKILGAIEQIHERRKSGVRQKL